MNTLDYALAALTRAAENGHAWSLTPNEAGLIVAEVERLRAGLADIEQIVLDGMAVTRHDGIAEGERRATERIVAWLRAHGTWCAVCEASAREYADCIERGEHRREGKD